MWERLRLRDLGVIAEAELEFGPSFTVITGETGAGKTMVVTALSLLRGDKADPGLVRHGADRAVVSAEIAAAPGMVSSRVIEAGGESEQGEIILTRTVAAGGRSRAAAGGVTVPASVLAEVCAALIAVHGQADQQRLVRADQQRSALDRYAGGDVESLLERYRPAWNRSRELAATLDDLRRHAVERQRELEFLKHGLDEVAAVDPQQGEDEQLLSEERRLSHAESLVRAARAAADALGDGDVSATAALSAALEALHGAAGHDADLDAVAARVQASLIDVTDIASDLNSYTFGVDLDPMRLAAVQERRAAIVSVQRRYGPGLDDVLQWADEAAARVGELDADDDTISAAEAELAEIEAELAALARRLSELRQAAAAELATSVGAELAALSMPSARLDIRVQPAELGPHGADAIEFWFAANNGSPLRPMARSASGGELSRLMLALEVVLADSDPSLTLVFDEVDAGIGGKAAVEVGRRLQRLARTSQVIAVTHLPQVAAFADDHFVVTKSDDGSITSSSVTRLDQQTRVDELARMLAGIEASAAAQEHARELLDLAAPGN